MLYHAPKSGFALAFVRCGPGHYASMFPMPALSDYEDAEQHRPLSPAASAVAFRSTLSDDEIFSFSVQVQFSTMSGACSNLYAIDEKTTYGTLSRLAIQFLINTGVREVLDLHGRVCDAPTSLCQDFRTLKTRLRLVLPACSDGTVPPFRGDNVPVYLDLLEDGIDEFVHIKICFTDPEVWVKALQQAPNTKVGIAPNSVVSLIAGMRSGHGLGPWKSSAFTAEGLGIGFVEIHEFHVYRCCLLREGVGFRS